MQHTAVTPPAAAARVPVATVSLYSCPGSRRWTCMSMKPGHTHMPAASITAAPAGATSLVPTRAILPSSISTSWTASTEPAGSITRPPRISSVMGFAPFGSWGWRLRAPAAREQQEHRHAHGHAPGDLVEDHRVRAVGDFRRQLDAAVDGAGMHDEHVGPRVGGQPVERETPVARVLAQRRDQAGVHPFLLQAQHHDDVDVADRVLQPVGDLAAELLDVG